MRAVAREVDLVSSAVYRYFPTREALLTAMIIESYGHLAEQVEAVSARSRERRWRGLARAMRDWARSSPHEFQLIYGTPIPGYVAPPETIPAAARVADPYLRCGAVQPLEPFGDRALRAQMADVAGAELDPSGVAATLAELAALVGFVNLELSGHFVGTADPADRLFDALVRRQCASLRLGDSVRP